MKPQSRDVLRLLERHPEGVTQHLAIREAACYRLAARISDLKKDGVAIATEQVREYGVRFARYRLVREPEQLKW